MSNSKFAVMSRMMKSTVQERKGFWVVSVDGKPIGHIVKNGNEYHACDSENTYMGVSHITKAISLIMPAFEKAELYSADAAIAVQIKNIKERLNWFKANPLKDPFVIAGADAVSPQVNVAEIINGQFVGFVSISDNALSKHIKMCGSFLDASAYIQNQAIKNGAPMVKIMRFSEALSHNLKVFEG